MFHEEEEWSDGEEAQVLSEAVLRKKENISTGVQSKAVGKRSLLRTLQALGTVPDWSRDEQQQDSDSETEAAPSPSKKKKKKRRKRRKHGEAPEEQQENGDRDPAVSQEEPAPTKKKRKDNKCAAPEGKITSTGEKKDPESAQVTVSRPDDSEKMSRQQWKNKMKNKRKCNNKYRQKEPEEQDGKIKAAGEQELERDTDSKPDSSSRETAARRRRIQQEAVETKVRVHTESSADGPQHRAAGPGETTTEDQHRAAGPEETTTEDQHRAAGPEETTTEDRQLPGTRTLKLSREQSLKRQRLRKLLQEEPAPQTESPAEPSGEPAAPEATEEEVTQSRSAALRSRMEQRLEAARFRYINEVLYSTTSGEARRMFTQDPQAFWVYHKGYTAQVQRWPSNPVDAIISYIQQRPSSLVVADFGCGDCKIARSVKNRVHSFDLAAACELVTVCDMSNVPLGDSSVDIAVFCLSLMGTNLSDFLAEANRVLKMRGVLKVAEVASRFDNVRNFLTALAGLGFKMASKDTENSHFYSFEFVKTGNAPENVKKFGLQLKPCVYKKR